MASKYWIKVYHEILDDPKMGRMPDRLWRRTIELFLIAGEQDDKGNLPKLGDMAYRLRMSDEELQKDLDKLQELNIVHLDDGVYVVTKFAERQAPVSSAERMKRYRERQQEKKYYGDDDDTEDDTQPVTPPVTKRSQIRKDKKREDMIRFDELKLSDDLFDDCMNIYKTLKGEFLPTYTFIDMVNNFKNNKVIAEDYYKAIVDQDASGKYPGANSPTSYESWTLTNAHKRLNPVTIENNNGHKKDDYPEYDPDKTWPASDGNIYNNNGEVVGTWKK